MIIMRLEVWKDIGYHDLPFISVVCYFKGDVIVGHSVRLSTYVITYTLVCWSFSQALHVCYFLSSSVSFMSKVHKQWLS